MNDIYIVVEGQTEQTFVRDVLAPYMIPKGMQLFPSLIGAHGHKGGDVRFDRAKRDIGNFLKQRKDIYVSTMFDYFRIDSDWPGRKDVVRRKQSGATLTATDKAGMLEAETHERIINDFPRYDPTNRFIPYIEMHEFEALLFSDTDVLADLIEIDVSVIREINDEYDNPEEINDDPAKAPSKQLAALVPGYRKIAMGKAISEAIGIPSIRNKCPHFDGWLRKLEKLQDIRPART